MRLAHYQVEAKLAFALLYAVGLGSEGDPAPAPSSAVDSLHPCYLVPYLVCSSIGTDIGGLGWVELLVPLPSACPVAGYLLEFVKY